MYIANRCGRAEMLQREIPQHVETQRIEPPLYPLTDIPIATLRFFWTQLPVYSCVLVSSPWRLQRRLSSKIPMED